MKTLALLFIAALALPVHAAERRTTCNPGDRTRPGSANICPAGAGSPVFVFAPSSGLGLPYSQELCDVSADAGHLTGNYMCQYGDGGIYTYPDSGTMIPVNAPVTVTGGVCPNGPDCTEVDGQFLNGTTQYYERSSAQLVSAAFTVCSLFQMYSTSGIHFLINSNDVGETVFQFYVNGVQLEFAVCQAEGNCGGTTWGGSITPMAHHLACATYDSAATAGEELRLYVDGTLSPSSPDGAPEPPQAVSNPLVVGRQNTGIRYWEGLIRGSFYTEKALTGAQIAALARATLADVPTGTRGETITFSRASAESCDFEAPGGGTRVSTVPPGRPCISDYRIQSNSAVTNLAIRSEEVCNAAWNSLASTCLSDQVLSPENTLTADKVTFTAVPGRRVSAIMTSSADGTCSVYMKRAVGTDQTVNVVVMGVGFVADATCPVTVTAEWDRYYCQTNGVAGVFRYCGIESITGDEQVYIWGNMYQLGTSVSSYIHTIGTAVAQAADLITVALPAGMNNTRGCVHASASWIGNPVGTVLWFNAGIRGLNLLDAATMRFCDSASNCASTSVDFFGYDNTTHITGTWEGTTLSLKGCPMGGACFSEIGTYGGTMVGTPVTIGDGSALGAIEGFVGDVKLGLTPYACGTPLP